MQRRLHPGHKAAGPRPDEGDHAVQLAPPRPDGDAGRGAEQDQDAGAAGAQAPVPSDVGHHDAHRRHDGLHQLLHDLGAVLRRGGEIQNHAGCDRREEPDLWSDHAGRDRCFFGRDMLVPRHLRGPQRWQLGRPREQGLAQREQHTRPLYLEPLGGAWVRHAPRQCGWLSRRAGGTDSHDGEQHRVPHHGRPREAVREAVGAHRQRGLHPVHCGAPHRRGAFRACQADCLRGRGCLRDGHALRLAHRRHCVHVRGDQRCLVAAGVDLPRLRRHLGVLPHLARPAQPLRHEHQGLRRL
mmetsp:Transcript_10079/g.28378  ORF Transcript_10079/g.28378 Transcript_10079/m.28378 type:complete len:297 (+) Transcript_10079:256-1146(+)